ncbi:DUF262 domain-containing protein [Exiguobacterium sp. SH5S4]|uniref:DUF262 domain-containing protein n=1 Tax=Exiguobacterium sp. SH5S4 TaxID=2510961 RepID=UPI0010401F2A|nr:DUF262 domain-containing protein [Exiguobacterium sp. SH5S4]TCI25271.1 DUF262 domain-containing protein [Exiguobacterium sp. SH5S4]
MIEISNNGWAVKQLGKMTENGKLRYDYPIQRAGGQWNREQQSYLVHSVASNFPIPPIYTVVYNERHEETDEIIPVRYVLDGKQRLTTLLDYINGDYATIESLDEIYIEGTKFEIAGKFFGDLDEEVQDAIVSKTLTLYTIKGEFVTDEEIEDLFFRMNNGTQLTKQQQAKAKMGVEWAKRLQEMSEHRVITEFAAFSKAQVNGEKHISAILQAMMMLDDYDYKNVSERVIADYSLTFKEDEENKFELFLKIEEAIQYLDRVFDEKEKVLMKKVHFPMMLTTARVAVENQISVPDFKNWLPIFKEELKKKDEETPSEMSLSTNYFIYTGKGSTDRFKADGRMNEMARHLKAYCRTITFNEQADALAQDEYENTFHNKKDVPF